MTTTYAASNVSFEQKYHICRFSFGAGGHLHPTARGIAAVSSAVNRVRTYFYPYEPILGVPWQLVVTLGRPPYDSTCNHIKSLNPVLLLDSCCCVLLGLPLLLSLVAGYVWRWRMASPRGVVICDAMWPPFV